MRLEVERQIRMLLERKRTLFAHERRMILDCKVIEEGGWPRLLVTSTFLKSPEEASP